MMSAKLKELVSKKKKRYQEDGFDLDLSYIGDRIIAMGYPAEKLEGVYRNHIDDVVRFLDSKHKDRYKIYNLCCERHYDQTKFHGPVACYPFADHSPPGVELMSGFCNDVAAWLAAHPENVAAVHCKAGKGRTGVMVCAYLLHAHWYETAEDALDFYGNARTYNSQGVTIPSQRRYVHYYGQLVARQLSYTPVTLSLASISFSPVPMLGAGTTAYFMVHQVDKKLLVSPPLEIRRGERSHIYQLPSSLTVRGDVSIVFYAKPKMKKKEKLLSFWFNTFFVELEHRSRTNGYQWHSFPDHRRFLSRPCESLTFTLPKLQLDKAVKDSTNKIFSADFMVSLTFRYPAMEELTSSPGRGGGQHSSSDSSQQGVDSEDTETEDEDDWDTTHV